MLETRRLASSFEIGSDRNGSNRTCIVNATVRGTEYGGELTPTTAALQPACHFVNSFVAGFCLRIDRQDVSLYRTYMYEYTYIMMYAHIPILKEMAWRMASKIKVCEYSYGPISAAVCSMRDSN